MDFLNVSIGSLEREVTIKEISKKNVNMQDKVSEKMEFTVEDENGRTFNISECWVEDYKGKSVKGLWYSLGKNGIPPMSTLAQFMRYNNVTILNDLVGKKVIVYPDASNYLVLSTCKITDEDIKNSVATDSAQPNKKADLFN